MGMCISASFFGSLSWKGSMLKIASGLSTGDTVTSHKLGMRIRMLYRLLRRNDTPVEVLDPHLFINNPRSNAQYGEQIILEMQVLLDQRASIGDIEENFAKFIPGHPKSTQERQVSLRGEEIIIKAMRFQGRLEDAKERYVELMTQYRKDSIPARFTASFAELLCDLGDTQRALHILGSEFDYRNKGAGRRLEMAVSQAHLTKGLWDFAREKFGEESRSSLNLARARFRSTINSLEGEGLHRLCQTNRGHYFVACAGLAMIEHISALILIREGAIPHCASVEKQLKTALQAWHTAHFAHEAARASWSGQGYSEVVILFSKSQLLHHLRDPGAKQVMDLAKQKHIQIGRHFHVVAHGTVWLQILKLCPDMDGRGRMAFWEVALNERER
ncbi:hypothetical protein F5883DRAFT_185248 [Diaporthe sp. PMI_573]|nr:hypothetical protein F5883DRAFT_185248 [Diaporthaceae sp. PMI_573]